MRALSGSIVQLQWWWHKYNFCLSRLSKCPSYLVGRKQSTSALSIWTKFSSCLFVFGGRNVLKLEKHLKSADLCQAAHFSTYCDYHPKTNTPITWSTFTEIVPSRSQIQEWSLVKGWPCEAANYRFLFWLENQGTWRERERSKLSFFNRSCTIKTITVQVIVQKAAAVQG